MEIRRPEANKPKGKVTAKESSGTLAAANPYRVELSVSNPSTKDVWLALGPAAGKEEGIWLKKESGTVTILNYTGEVTCITTEGEGTIAYVEV